MARPATGQVIVRKTNRGQVFALRFPAYGKRRYLTLGSPADGWNRQRAEDKLANVLADVRRGIWQPSSPDRIEGPSDPTFHEFASEWLAGRRGELRPRTITDYEWSLGHHLLPFFMRHRLTEITVAKVDRYKATKLSEGKLAPAQINKTLKLLAQILDFAIEYEILDRANPARGRRRRVKESRAQRTWVEPEQALALLEGASTYMRPVIATLIGAGLRVGEAVAMDWSDVNLATGTLRVGRSKTDAGIREVDMPGGLVDELAEWKMRSAGELEAWLADHPGAGAPVFLSAHAGRIRRQTEANVARRLKTAIKHGNRKLDRLWHRADLGPRDPALAKKNLRQSPGGIRR
jgi:integrase